jgi:HPt (histidine-containing phosphotransfer) domain-containing protein
MTQLDGDGAGKKIIVNVDRDLEDLIPRFMDNRQNDIVTIRNAVEQEDYETVRSLAHCLKGCGAGYGFNEITEIGATLEQAAKAKDRQKIEEWLNCLAQYLGKIEIVYE